MHIGKCALLALGAVASSVNAYRDTSPFFFFSTQEFETTSQQLQTASSLQDDTVTKLSSCPSDFYVLVSQPGVHVVDYSSRKSAPRLRDGVLKKGDAVQSSSTVSEVVGQFDLSQVQKVLESKCSAKTVTVDVSSGTLPSSYEDRPVLIKVDFPTLPVGSSRASKLVENDAFLATLLDYLPSPNYSVVYTTTPRGPQPIAPAENSPYEMDGHSLQNPINQRAKRDVYSPRDDDDDNNDGEPDDRKLSLFGKYQFLTPGIFMGLMVTIVLISLLYVGLSALGSLTVSYASFSKENGPAAAAKKQQ